MNPYICHLDFEVIGKFQGYSFVVELRLLKKGFEIE